MYYLHPFSVEVHRFCGSPYFHKKKGEAEINSINTLRRHVFGFSSMFSTSYTLYFFHSKLAPIFRVNYRHVNFLADFRRFCGLPLSITRAIIDFGVWRYTQLTGEIAHMPGAAYTRPNTGYKPGLRVDCRGAPIGKLAPHLFFPGYTCAALLTCQSPPRSQSIICKPL